MTDTDSDRALPAEAGERLYKSLDLSEYLKPPEG